MPALAFKKSPAKVVTEVVKSELEALVDHVGADGTEVEKIKKKIKALQDELKPFADRQSQLQKLVDELELGDDDSDLIKGDHFRLEVGPRGKSRKVKDMDKARDLLGDELFMKLATVTLKNLDDYLNPQQREVVIETTRSSRSIKLAKV